MTSTDRTPTKDPGKRATALVRELARPDSDVYELFAQLDALPKDTVLAALASTTGPSRPPEELDDDLRQKHGFPAPPLRLMSTRVVKPTASMRLGETTVEQIERACTTWDGLVLPFATRLAEGGELALLGTLEHHTFDDLDGMPQYDVVLIHGDSGAIFRAGETDVFGTIAYGKVEVLDRRERLGLQAAIDGEPLPELVVVETLAPEEEESAPVEAPAPAAKPAAKTKSVAKTKKAPAAKKASAAVAKKKAPVAKKASAAVVKKKAPAAKKTSAAAKKKAPATKKTPAVAKKKAPATKKTPAVAKKKAPAAKKKPAVAKKTTKKPTKKKA